MEKNVEKLIMRLHLKRNILFFALILVVFFPMKGVISFVFQYGFGYNISKYFGIFFIAIMILPLSYVVINNSHLKKTSEVFFYSVFVFLGLAFSILSKDANLLHSSFVIFGLPVVLSWVKGIDDSTIFYLFGIFFKFTIFFILIEACVIHLGLFGRISYDEIMAYQSSFTSGTLTGIFDSRTSGGVYRTGGYLGNKLAMPALVLLSFIFFYINNKVHHSYKGFLMSVAGAISLLISASATAILAGLITVIFYEIFVCRNIWRVIRYLAILTILSIPVIFILIQVSSIGYIFERLLNNVNNADYLNNFIKFDGSLVKLFQFFFIGGWKSALEGVPSHNDFINLLFMFGILPVLMLIRRWYSAIKFGLKSRYDSPGHVFSVMLISLFLTFFHHHMGLTIYSMIIGTIMLLSIEKTKSGMFEK